MTHNDSALPLCGVKQTKAKLILMLIKIAELILELKAEKSNAQKLAFRYEDISLPNEKFFNGKVEAFDLCIQKLGLLLDAEAQTTVKKPEA